MVFDERCEFKPSALDRASARPLASASARAPISSYLYSNFVTFKNVPMLKVDLIATAF